MHDEAGDMGLEARGKFMPCRIPAVHGFSVGGYRIVAAGQVAP